MSVPAAGCNPMAVDCSLTKREAHEANDVRSGRIAAPTLGFQPGATRSAPSGVIRRGRVSPDQRWCGRSNRSDWYEAVRLGTDQ